MGSVTHLFPPLPPPHRFSHDLDFPVAGAPANVNSRQTKYQNEGQWREKASPPSRIALHLGNDVLRLDLFSVVLAWCLATCTWSAFAVPGFLKSKMHAASDTIYVTRKTLLRCNDGAILSNLSTLTNPGSLSLSP